MTIETTITKHVIAELTCRLAAAGSAGLCVKKNTILLVLETIASLVSGAVVL